MQFLDLRVNWESRVGYSVNDEGDVCLDCGGKELPDLPYRQVSPLRPVSDPKPVPLAYESTKTDPFFGGSCIQTIDNLIFHTGHDGILRVSEISETPNLFPGVNEFATWTDDRLNSSRIYNINLQKQDKNLLAMVRYKNGFSHLTFDGESFQNLVSVPSSGGAISQCFPGLLQSCMLDLKSNINLLDLQTNKLKFRKHVEFKVEESSWGMLCKGRSSNNICLAARKSFGLLDIRSGNVEVMKDLDEFLFVRNVECNEDKVYVSTDEQVFVYDLRTLGQLVSLPLYLQQDHHVQVTQVESWEKKTWILTGSTAGDISLGVLDYSHDNCHSFVPADSRIKTQCTSEEKVPDVCGGFRLLKGWSETVALGRLEAGVWMESSVEQRVDIEFRGLSMHKSEDSVSVYTINAVGDLFATTLSLQPDDDEMEDDLDLVVEYEEVLETWANKVNQLAGTKTFYAQDFFSFPKGHRQKSSVFKEGNEISQENPCLKLSRPYHGNVENRIPNLRQKNIKYSEFKGGVSANIVKILGMKVVEPTLGDEANGDNDCVEQSLVPPTVDDPDFALRSFLTDLGVPEENQTDANLSQFQGLI